MILALETSAPRASLAVVDSDGEVLWDRSFETERAHNAVIFEPLKEALEVCKGSLERIAVGLGPGSYAGARVGIAVANGLALSRGVATSGVCSLLAYDTEAVSYGVIGDARRGTFFRATIEERTVISGPDLVEEAELKEWIAKSQYPLFSADLRVVENFSEVSLVYPAASHLGKQATEISSGPEEIPPPLEPIYLRAPYITQAKKKPIGKPFAGR
ncbi:MAG: tRNA (adenosine(37)-N6)-threonylcarbamoyltransferase complex dimerization subunit type 1 TsaB [Verrucomicrobiota bacterium]